MELEIILLSEVTHAQKDKCCFFSFVLNPCIYMFKLE